MLAVSTVEILHGAGRAQVSAPARRTASDDSKGSWPSRLAFGASRLASVVSSGAGRTGLDPAYLAALGLAIAAVAGPLLLIVSDFTTLFEARTVTAVIPGGRVAGGSQHLYAMVIIGLVALPMAYGAIRGGSQPSMIALAVFGVLAIGIALAKDLPAATGPSTIKNARAYESTQSTPKLGLYLETLGAALLLIAGGGSLVLTAGLRGGNGRRDPQPEPTADERRREQQGRDERQRADAAAARAAARTARQEQAGPTSDAPSASSPTTSPGRAVPRQPAIERSGGLARLIGEQLGRRRRR